jgi:hypothetical protein
VFSPGQSLDKVRVYESNTRGRVAIAITKAVAPLFRYEVEYVQFDGLTIIWTSAKTTKKSTKTT